MDELVTIMFYKIIDKYLKQLSKIDFNYFKSGKAADNAILNKKDQFVIFSLKNEQMVLLNIYNLIIFFKLMTLDFINANSNASRGLNSDHYSLKIYQLIQFNKTITSLNSLSHDLCISNPSESGLHKVISDMGKEFYTEIISCKSYKDEKFNDYIIEITKSIDELIYTQRILLVNSAYLGINNPFYNISKKISKWLYDEIADLKNNIKTKKG